VVPIEKQESGKQNAAEGRNSERIIEANKKDITLLSEYLPEDIRMILPEPIAGPDDAFDPEEDFLARLTEVAATETDPIRHDKGSAPEE
jgi:hypothetical protein